MSTRIRYGASELDPVLKKSKKFFDAKGKKYYVVLNEDSFHYVILDAKSKEVVRSGGNTKNKTVLRNQAKKALVDLGVTFDGETRNKKVLEAIESSPIPNPTQYVTKDEVMDLIETRLMQLLTSKPSALISKIKDNEKLVG